MSSKFRSGACNLSRLLQGCSAFHRPTVLYRALQQQTSCKQAQWPLAHARNQRSSVRRFCSNANKKPDSSAKDLKNNDGVVSETIDNAQTSGNTNRAFWQRIKQRAKDYGKTFIIVHYVSTYTIWFGSFYYLSYMGVNIRWFLEKINTSEETMQRLENSRFSHAAIAYILVKMTSPVRIVASVGLTELALRALRARGIMPAVAQTERLRDLWRRKGN